MPPFTPFRGVRYDLERFDPAKVTAPPYDVIDQSDRDALLEIEPHNAARIDLPPPEGYAAAATTFERWLGDGVLVRDPTPCFYGYRMTHVDDLGRVRHTTGAIGALGLPGEDVPGSHPVLPHEHTTPKARSDRLELQRATRANLSPIWGLSPVESLTALFEAESPLASWTDRDRVTHTMWRIEDPGRCEEISLAVASAPVLIADGHHRFETALAYRAENPAATTVMTYVVELDEGRLTVDPIHRLLGGLPADFDLLDALGRFFDVTRAGPVGPHTAGEMVERGALLLVSAEGTRFLRPRPEAFAGCRDLDSSRLDLALASMPPHELRFQHGIDEIVASVAAGSASAGVLLRPATVAQIVEVAHGGERMPPKTTYFRPKPRTGVVFALLDGN